MKRALAVLFLALAPAFAGRFILTFSGGDPASAGCRILVATNGGPWSVDQVITTNQMAILQLPPGRWRVGWQTFSSAGATSEISSVTLTMPAPPEPPKQWKPIILNDQMILIQR